MATAREYFKFMRECARAGQVVQLQSTADGKYVVYGWGRELRPLGKPLSTPAAALAAALRWQQHCAGCMVQTSPSTRLSSPWLAHRQPRTSYRVSGLWVGTSALPWQTRGTSPVLRSISLH